MRSFECSNSFWSLRTERLGRFRQTDKGRLLFAALRHLDREGDSLSDRRPIGVAGIGSGIAERSDRANEDLCREMEARVLPRRSVPEKRDPFAQRLPIGIKERTLKRFKSTCDCRGGRTMPEHPGVCQQVRCILKGLTEMNKFPVNETEGGPPDQNGGGPQVSHGETAAGSEQSIPKVGECTAQWFDRFAKALHQCLRNAGILDTSACRLNLRVAKANAELREPARDSVEVTDEPAEVCAMFVERHLLSGRFLQIREIPQILQNEQWNLRDEPDETRRTHPVVGEPTKCSPVREEGKGIGLEMTPPGIERDVGRRGDEGGSNLDDPIAEARRDAPYDIQQSARQTLRAPDRLERWVKEREVPGKIVRIRPVRP